MKLNKFLVTVNNLDIINDLKKVGVTTFLFPLRNYSVGFPNTFSLDEILEENAYVFINRILSSTEIDELKKLLYKIPENIKGIVFDDLGVLEIINDLKIDKILYLNHFGTNYESINYFLDYVDSMVISTDITQQEIYTILDNTKKPLTIYGFGYVPVMYSRRLLLSNFNQHFNLENINNANISDKIAKNKFKVYENEFGTILYHNKPSSSLQIEHDNILYHLINTVFLNDQEVLELFKSIRNNQEIKIEHDNGFLNKPTIYKLKDGN